MTVFFGRARFPEIDGKTQLMSAFFAKRTTGGTPA